MRSYRPIAIFTFVLVSSMSLAGEVTVTPAGVRSLGSSTAYVATCEKEGHIAVGTLADLIGAMREGLTTEHWNSVKAQYQESLHDRRQYSVSKNQWFPFRINRPNCDDLAKAIPSIKSLLVQSKR